MLNVTHTNAIRITLDRNRFGRGSGPINGSSPLTREKREILHHSWSQVPTPILRSANSATRRRTAPRRGFQSFSLTRPTNCEWISSLYPILGCLFFFPVRYSPALIQSSGAMKCLLDAMLVLTKQDRLCHIIHATSEPFYQTWLRKANVMQHCKVRILQTHPYCVFILISGGISDSHHR